MYGSVYVGGPCQDVSGSVPDLLVGRCQRHAPVDDGAAAADDAAVVGLNGRAEPRSPAAQIAPR